MEHVLLLRLYIEVKTEEEAQRTINELAKNLRNQCAETHRKIGQYWKIPEYFEVLLELNPVGIPKKAFYDVLKMIGDGWELHDEQIEDLWAIWNFKEDNPSVYPSIRWANLELTTK